jgi:hypothetical protein
MDHPTASSTIRTTADLEQPQLMELGSPRIGLQVETAIRITLPGLPGEDVVRLREAILTVMQRVRTEVDELCAVANQFQDFALRHQAEAVEARTALLRANEALRSLRGETAPRDPAESVWDTPALSRD